jgi:hypothetical protein
MRGERGEGGKGGRGGRERERDSERVTVRARGHKGR